ncbi:MAG: alpha-hydroxy acid oxidase [Gemmatimonadota bacterium]
MSQPSSTALPHNVDDCQKAARERLPHDVYEYYARGAEDEVTLRGNRGAFSDLHFRPRVLVDVTRVDSSCRLLGTDLPSPVILAPTAFQKLCHPDGELATVQAAGRAGHLMVASTLATSTIEEIAQAAETPLWLQLYVFRDRTVTESLVRRAADAGCQAICLTVDVPVQGNREHDVRNNFGLHGRGQMANFVGHIQSDLPDTDGDSGLNAFIRDQSDTSLTWDAVRWLKELADVPVVVKGIQHPGDGELAVEAGADAVVVSNHGGRQLDGAEPTIRLLPDVVAAVKGRVPVLLDGGVRRGSDVAKALCLGADAVMIGRPYLWGLTLAGSDGVAHVLEILDGELRRVMALLGCRELSELGPDRLAPLPAAW